jgi:hypothetical protein
VEVALDLYPARSGAARCRRSGREAARADAAERDVAELPLRVERVPQGQFAVAITLDDPDQIKFPIGTQGARAIYTNPDSAFVILRKIAIRGYTWYNWLYPFSG